MRLDRENGRCLGVCAGIAKWLDVPATLVRIVFVLCVIAWPPFLIGYFILYFCLDKDISTEKMQNYFSGAKTAEHFRRLDYRKPIRRNERDKKIAGVCAGIADYLEVSAFTVRLLTLLSLFVFGPFTFWAYVICWFVFDPDPGATDSERYERKAARRRRRHERRAERHARRKSRRQSRKSYVNEEFQADMKDFEADVEDVVDEAHVELKAEIDDAFSGFTRSAGKRAGKRAERQNSRADGDKTGADYSRRKVTTLYSELEKRLREIEAFMTSKKFRLHCQINRI